MTYVSLDPELSFRHRLSRCRVSDPKTFFIERETNYKPASLVTHMEEDKHDSVRGKGESIGQYSIRACFAAAFLVQAK